MKESHIEKSCVDMAKRKGYHSRKVTFHQNNGAPDRIFFKLGHFFWVEFKAPKGVTSEIQKYQQNLLIESGQEVHNIFSIEDFSKLLK